MQGAIAEAVEVTRFGQALLEALISPGGALIKTLICRLVTGIRDRLISAQRMRDVAYPRRIHNRAMHAHVKADSCTSRKPSVPRL